MRIAVDTREQRPWAWPGVETEVRTIRSGDYCLIGSDGELLDHLVVVERKSLSDYVGTVGRGRERFVRELERLSSACLHPWVVIEGTPRDVAERNYPGKMTPAAIVGSTYAWAIRYQVQFVWAADRACAQAIALKVFGEIDRQLSEGSLEDGGNEWLIQPRELQKSSPNSESRSSKDGRTGKQSVGARSMRTGSRRSG